MFTSVVQNLKELLSGESVLKENKKLDLIIQEFNKLKNESNESEDINLHLANDLINEIRKKVKEEKEIQKKQSESIKEKKILLIQKLEELINNEQNIGKAFSDLKTIRKSWTELTDKAPLEQKDVDKKFTKKIEDFYYNINIYKAIQEHDLKRNQQLKEIILKKLEKAASTEATKNLIQEIKRLRMEWESIGPVSRDIQDAFWSKYRALLDQLYNNFKDFKTSEKEEQILNRDKKTAIIHYINNIETSEIKNNKDWKLIANTILNKQEEWNSIGFVPKESKDELWKAYRSSCDVFFEAKKKFFDKQKKVFKSNKTLKNSLCKKAEDLLKSESLNDQTNDFIEMQSEWKKIGPVHQRDEQYLWHRFQKTCNIFFQNQKETKKKLVAEKDSLNIEKETIIKQLTKESIESENQLIEHLSLWWKSNRDFTRKSIQLENQFFEVVESKLKDKTHQELESENIKLKIEIYREFNDEGSMLSKESQKIKDKLSTLQKDISQYENNLSFFGNSKGTEILMKDVYLKMDKLNSEISSLKNQLKLIKNSLK
jgi:hypothetical protein